MFDDLFKKIEKNYPDILTTKDLINIGLYSTPSLARYARKNNKGPEYFRLDGKILYVKAGVLKFLQEKLEVYNKSTKENLETLNKLT